MLDLMLTAENPDSHEKKLTDDEIVANCMVFLLATYKTTNGTLGLTCYYLATNPNIQERLQREVDQSWTDELEQPTYESVQEMTYMDMVISGTLRVCPPGTMQHIRGRAEGTYPPPHSLTILVMSYGKTPQSTSFGVQMPFPGHFFQKCRLQRLSNWNFWICPRVLSNCNVHSTDFISKFTSISF